MPDLDFARAAALRARTGAHIVDLVYRDREPTPLVRRARERGLVAIDGREVLLGQAVLGRWAQHRHATQHGMLGPGAKLEGASTRTETDLLMRDGNVGEARKLLGRYYQVSGVVSPGRNRGGRLLGFPTANIKLKEELCPKNGIYAVTVDCRGKRHQGVANIGYSPTFEDHEFTVEVHILDFDDNIYGDKIRVNFIQRIRDEIKFSNISELIEQIKKDIAAAREIFSK